MPIAKSPLNPKDLGEMSNGQRGLLARSLFLRWQITSLITHESYQDFPITGQAMATSID